MSAGVSPIHGSRRWWRQRVLFWQWKSPSPQGYQRPFSPFQSAVVKIIFRQHFFISISIDFSRSLLNTCPCSSFSFHEWMSFNVVVNYRCLTFKAFLIRNDLRIRTHYYISLVHQIAFNCKLCWYHLCAGKTFYLVYYEFFLKLFL